MTTAVRRSVNVDREADIAPTQIGLISDLAAPPLAMACSTWMQPQAIAMSQNCTFKSLSQTKHS